MRAGRKKNHTQEKKREGSYRIIAGKWRSRRLSFPEVDGLRPTTDRVRETVFNWLMHQLENAQVLDLFAGSGSLGFEALSRGAKAVSFIEKNATASTYLQTNVATLDASATVYCRDALTWLASTPSGEFDVVFLDPPFRQGLLPSVIAALDQANILRAGAMVYLEQEKELAMVEVPKAWQLRKEKVAGQVAYRLYEVVLAKE